MLNDRDLMRGRWVGAAMAMPKLEPGIALFLMQAWVIRERKGADFCRKKLVGPLRVMARTPPVVVDICGSPPTVAVLQECRDILALHCKACGACDCSNDAP